MAEKTSAEVIIGGKVYTLSGYEGEEYLQKVATYINNKLEREIEQKEKEIYDLKHDLISNQIKAESDEKARKELEEQNKELLINKAKLEASLEDALLGKVPEKDKTEE